MNTEKLFLEGLVIVFFFLGGREEAHSLWRCILCSHDTGKLFSRFLGFSGVLGLLTLYRELWLRHGLNSRFLL